MDSTQSGLNQAKAKLYITMVLHMKEGGLKIANTLKAR